MTRQDLAKAVAWATFAGVLFALSDGGWQALVAIVAGIYVAHAIGRADGRAEERAARKRDRDVVDLDEWADRRRRGQR